MKNLIFFLISIFFLTSCNTRNTRNFNMRVCSGEGIFYTETWVKCDSFQMVSNKEAYVWVDGVKMKIVGDRGIKPETN